jgi:hypothetical protein
MKITHFRQPSCVPRPPCEYLQDAVRDVYITMDLTMPCTIMNLLYISWRCFATGIKSTMSGLFATISPMLYFQKEMLYVSWLCFATGIKSTMSGRVATQQSVLCCTFKRRCALPNRRIPASASRNGRDGKLTTGAPSSQAN